MVPHPMGQLYNIFLWLTLFLKSLNYWIIKQKQSFACEPTVYGNILSANLTKMEWMFPSWNIGAILQSVYSCKDFNCLCWSWKKKKQKQVTRLTADPLLYKNPCMLRITKSPSRHLLQMLSSPKCNFSWLTRTSTWSIDGESLSTNYL